MSDELIYDHEAMTAELAGEPEVDEREEDASQPPDDQAVDEPHDDGASEDGPPASEAQSWVIDGQEYGEEAIRAAARFRSWLAANPQRAEELVAWERGERVMVPAAQPEDTYQTWQPPEPEQTWDDDEYLTDEEKRVRLLEQRLNAYEAQQAQIREAEDRDIIDSGLSTFREAHPELDADGFNSVLLTLRDRGWLSNLNNSNLSPTQRFQAVQNLMEDAYRIVYFETALDQARSQAQQNLSKQVRAQRRAAAAGGTAPSVPRSDPDPRQMSDDERFRAMTAEISAVWANQ